MRQDLDRIFTGNAQDCGARGYAIVHACKTCHKKLCGQPAQDHPEYLTAEDDGELYLNIIDPDKPLFKADLFQTFTDWAERRWRQGESVLIHCDQGQSRARTLAILLGVRVGLLPSASYLAASVAFSRQSGLLYRPGLGIKAFVGQHWRELMEQNVVKERAAPKKAVAEAAWKDSGAKKIADERKLYDGYTLEELDEIAESPAKWAMLHGKVEDRVSKEAIPFKPSPLQHRTFAYYEYCQEHQAPCRIVEPKIRRGGGSTGAEAIMYCHAHNYVARIGSIGTDDEVATNMFKMVQFFDRHDTFKGWGRASKILEGTGFIQWGNGSTWEKYTAERPDSARSAGLQGYHASEVGRWPNGGVKDAKETLRSMLGAVPRRGFTVVIEESTAQGATGAFYDRFQSARWPTAEELGCTEGNEWWRKWADETPQNIAGSETERALQFVRIFAAWFEDDENRPPNGITPEEERKIKATLDGKELKLIQRYKTHGPQGERLGYEAQKATLWEQLAWRRAVIATEFEGDEDGFSQENPASPQEAFMASGRHSFNRSGCAWMANVAKGKTPQIGVLDLQGDKGVIFRETDKANAWFQMWETPREGMSYLVGIDTMGGISQSKNPEDTDFNAAIVMRRAYIETETGKKRPHRVVGSLIRNNQDDPDILAFKAALVSDFYGGCMVVHEDNNTGAAFRQEALRLGINLYRRVETDKFTAEQTELLGWITNKETRPQLFSTGKRHIRNNAQESTREEGVECWDETVCEEAAECVVGPDQKDAAPGSKHDDHLLAFLIALHTIAAATYYAGKKRRKTGPADRHLWRPAR